MKKAVGTLFVSLMILGSAYAQDVTTVQAMNSDISDHLDLEAVAAVFAESEDLEDFEKRLNDPESRLSNLDMNEDGYVDYLRVMENADADARLITIQAVVGKDLYQDVATIDVDIDERGQTRVQVVGDVFMYGPNYVIEPVYRYRPRIFVYLWAPRINPWCSTFYWGFYPSYWSYWAPYSYYNYYSHIHAYHYHGFASYYYRGHRRSYACASMYRRTARQDYAHHHPGRTFTQRNSGYTNRKALEDARPANYHTAMANTKENRVDATNVTANSKPNNAANSRPASQWNDATASNQKPNTSSKVDRVDRTDANVSARPASANGRPAVQEDWSKPSETASAQRDDMSIRPVTQSNSPSVSTKPEVSSRPSNTERPAATTRPQEQSTRPAATERPSQTTRPSSSSSRSTPDVSRSSSRSSGSQAQPSRSSSRSTASPAPSRSSTGSSSRSSSSSSRSSSSASSTKSSSKSSSGRR